MWCDLHRKQYRASEGCSICNREIAEMAKKLKAEKEMVNRFCGQAIAGVGAADDKVMFGPATPGMKFDAGKTQWTLLPWEAVEKIVVIMMFGAKKYAPNNWKKVEPPIRYIDACYRHLNAWCNGEQNDKETGYSHLWHAGCNIVFAIWLELKGKLVCPKGE